MHRLRFRHSVCLVACIAFALPAAAQSPVPPAGAVTSLVQVESSALTPVDNFTENLADNPNAIRVLLSSDLETTLAAEMVGRVSSLHAQLGQRIEKGQLIVSFDCSEASARLNMAQAEYASMLETLNVKERLRTLEAAGDMEVRLAVANADKAKAAIAITQVQLEQCSVYAPFSGHIVKTSVKTHQGVTIGTPLVEMIGDGPLKLRLNVPSRWLRQLQVGTPFEVNINETGRSYPAKIALINARVDAVAQTIEVEARMDNAEPDLLAGMSGSARFFVEP